MSQQGAFAVALLDPTQPVPAGLSTWNGSDPTRRFAVYRNNVAHSLVEALADTFPVTCRVVGATLFQQLALAFVRESPPRSPILAGYGAAFPAHLECLAYVHGVACAADLARLEFLRLMAYHAADEQPISVCDLRTLLSRPSVLPELRVALHPSVRVFRSSHAVVSLWAANQSDEANNPDALPLTGAEQALIVRAGLAVLLVPIEEASAAFIEGLGAGRKLAVAASEASSGDVPFDLAGALAILIRHHAITRTFESPENPS